MAEFGAEAYRSLTEGQVQSQDPTIQRPSMPSLELFLNLDCLDEAAIKAAYDYCRQITRSGSKTFYFGSLFLPYQKRQAMWAVYSFCRFTDDMVDNVQGVLPEEVRARLEQWEIELRRSFEGNIRPDLPHMIAWNHATRHFKIPASPPLELIEGVRMDLDKVRYANFEELRLYCYRVASTVGLMASEVIGYSDPCALEYAVNLGIAMQLTNILRDVGEDLENGRVYLPQDEMEEYGYSEEQLMRREVNQNFVRLMQFQISRARHYYEQAIPGIEYLNKECRLSITVAAQLYSRILDRIERNGYDVFTRRAFVPTGEKVRGLAGAWLRRRFGRSSLPPAPLRHLPRHEEADA